MDILALDLGTSTGYAYNLGDDFVSGTWTLATPKEVTAWGKQRKTRTDDPRIARLCENLDDLDEFDVIIIEDVLFASSTYQVQLWSSLRAAVWLCGKTKKFEALPVSTLKKFATGSGNADKAAMSKYLKIMHPKIWTPSLGDDTIDAIWLHIWAKQNLCRMKI